MTKRAALLSSLASLISRVGGRESLDHAVDEGLARCVDTLGARVGAVYVPDARGRMDLQALTPRHDAAVIAILEALPDQIGVTPAAMLEGTPLLLPGPGIAAPAAESILAGLKARQGLLLPFATDREPGLFFVASHRADLHAPDVGSFARAAAQQIGEAVALSRAVGAISAAEERTRLILDTAGTGIYGVDREGRCTFVNAAAARMLGYPAAGLIGASLCDLVHRSHDNGPPDETERCPIIGAARAGQSCELKSESCPLMGGLRSAPSCRLASAMLWRRDGSCFPAAHSIQPILEGGAVQGAVVTFEDISERVRDEARLRASEARFRHLFEDNMIGMCIADRAGVIVEANEALLRLLGCTRADVEAGQVRWDELTPAEFAGNDGRAIDPLRECGASDRWEREYVRKDGSRIAVQIGCRMLEGSEGQCLAFVLDVTDGKAAAARQAALVRLSQNAMGSGELSALLGEACVAAGHTLGVDGCYLIQEIAPGGDFRVLAGFGSLAGAVGAVLPRTSTAQAVYTLACRDPIVVDDMASEKRFTPSSGLLAQGLVSGLTVRIASCDKVYGCLGAFSTRKHPFTAIDGNFLHAVANIVGLALGRSETEEALRRNEYTFRTLIENVQDLIIELDTAGRILFISPSVERILGYRPAEMVGSMSVKFAHPEDLETVRSMLATALERPGEPRFNPIRWRDLKGNWRLLESIGVAVAGTNGEVRFILNARDVTERQSLESQLHQAQKMEAVGQLAGGVAHDFNNLLTIISGYGELLLNQYEVGDKRQVYLLEITGAAKRAAALTRQLLAFSRKQIVSPRTHDLNEVVRDVEKMLRRLIGEDVLLETDLRGTCLVNVDAGQMEQVLLNLSINARDAMPQGGRIRIATSQGRRPDDPGAYVVLEVCDTGEGMPEEVLAHIFEPFFTTKEPGKGTGLGLSTVYGIIRQSNGHVAVESTPGKGTCIRIHLPHVLESNPADPPAEPGIPKRGHETILLAEDEEPVRRYVHLILQRLGYTVLVARDGREALRLLEENAGQVQMLLTDTIMPRMSGRELAERARERQPDLRVLYMSGYTDDVLLRAGMQAAEVAFLEKPFHSDTLAARLRQVLDGPAHHGGRRFVHGFQAGAVQVCQPLNKKMTRKLPQTQD